MKRFRLTAIILTISAAAMPGFARAELPGQTTPADAAFVFIYQEQKFPVDQSAISSWQGTRRLPAARQIEHTPPSVGYSLGRHFGFAAKQDSGAIIYKYKIDRVYGFVKTLSEKINAEAAEPKLSIENNRAVDFSPPRDGLKVNLYESALAAIAALEAGKTQSELKVFTVKPQTSLSQLNELGIHELVATGESNFRGSPRNRKHNIKIGVEKMKGVIVAPGEEFSFNTFLGPVVEEAGFLPELVIKKTGTVPELGGGLCQVSSTVFRAAMDAGLPITQRRNHAYAVQYYAPQGTDATIYPGVVDLKFKNDTSGHLMIWPRLTDKDGLVFEFYGTKDSRKVVLSKPVQYDRKSDGSMKALWTREVIKDGVSTKVEFKSVYQPPALFHKEEKFVGASSTPATIPASPVPAAPLLQAPTQQPTP